MLVQLREPNARIPPTKVQALLRAREPVPQLNNIHSFSSKAFCYLVGSEGVKAFPTGLFSTDKFICKDLCVVQTQPDFLCSKTHAGR